MAASKVNKNFVVLLITVIVALVFGVGGFAFFAFARGGSRNVARGDEAMAAGNYEAAHKAYSRAVNRDGTNVEWLNKWRDALSKWTPTNETEYRKAYQTYYIGVLKKIAQVKNRDPKAQREFLAELDGFFRHSNSNAESLRGFIREVDDCLRSLPKDDPETTKLLRYRGLAQLDVASLITIPDEDRNKALQDLQAVAAIDPSDWEVGLGIMRWHLLDADLKARSRRDTDAENARQKAKAQLDDMLKANPNQPEAIVAEMIVRQTIDAVKLVKLEDKTRMLAEYQPMARKVFERLMQIDPTEIRTELMWQVVSRVRPLLGREGAELALKLADRVLEARPDSPEMLMIAAEMTYETGDLPRTFERFQKIADIKDRPVSRSGMMIPSYRRSAIGRQVDTALDQWRRAKDPAAKEEAMRLAKSYREKLKSIVDIGSENELKLRDAYIAIAEGRNDAAIKTLSEINASTTGSADHRVLLPLAEALDRVGNTGDALATYERLIKAGYIDSGVYTAASMLSRKLLNMDKAYEYAQQALSLDTDNAALKSLVEETRQASYAAKGNIDEVKDPVMLGVLRARKLVKDGESRAARQAFDALYKNAPKDPRVIQQYVQFLVNDDNRARAIEVLDKAIEDNPGEKLWGRMKTVVQIADPTEAALALIDQSDAAEVDKLAEKYRLFAKNGSLDKMEEVFQQAIAKFPDDSQVIEMAFLRALGNIVKYRGPSQRAERAAAEAEANKYLAKATERNLDQLNGLLFRGRLNIAQEKFKDAAMVIKQATDKVPNNPTAWRLLAMAYMESGQVNEGLDAYRRAMEGRPNDGSIAKDYARALIRTNRGKMALDLVNPDTGVLRFVENTNDEELLNIWLDLSAQYGGNEGVAKAIERRRIIFNRQPDMMINTVALSRLLINSGQFDEARKVLDAMAKSPNAIPGLTTRLNADWYAAQGKIPEGDKTYKDFIASLGDKVTVRNWLEYSEWLLDYNMAEAAMLAMNEGRKHQTRLHEADRTLGDFLFNGYGRLRDNAEKFRQKGDEARAKAADERAHDFLEGAREAYSAIVDDDADEAAAGFPVMKRLCETLIRLERYDEAGKVLDKMVQGNPQGKNEDDLQFMLLRATIIEKRGDARTARKMYDKAVETFPGDPRPYMARAILNAKDDNQFPDTVADLNQVVRMQPGNSIAWNMLFVLHERRGLQDQAFGLLNKAIDQNPGNDDLNALLIDRMRNMGRNEEALSVYMRLVGKEKKTDAGWVYRAASFAAAMERWRDAASLFQSLREMPGGDSPENTRLLLHCLLMRLNPLPEKQEIGKLLRAIESDGTPQDDLATTMLRARAEAFLGDTEKAMSLASQAFKMCEGSRQLYAWYVDAYNMIYTAFKRGNQFYRDMPDGAIQARKEVFARFRNVRDPVPPMLRILEIPFRQRDGESIQKLLDEVIPLEQQLGDDLPAKVELYRAKNQLYYALGRYEESLAACQEGLKLIPDGDVEFNNNAAYTLSKHLNRPQEALPFGLAALRVSATNSSVLDTVGQIYLQLKEYSKATETLAKAVDTARDPDQTAAANIHLGFARLAQNPPDIASARKCHDRAREAVQKLPEYAKKQYVEDLEALSKKVQ